MPMHMNLWINTQLLTLLTCWGGISEMTMMLFVAVAVISLLCNHVGSIWKTQCHSQVVSAEEGTWHDAILASWVLSMVTERIQVFSHVLDFRSSFSKGFAWLIFWFPFHWLFFCVACRRQHDIKPWVRAVLHECFLKAESLVNYRRFGDGQRFMKEMDGLNMLIVSWGWLKKNGFFSQTFFRNA